MFGYRVFRVGRSYGATSDYIKSIRIYLKIIESKSNFSFTRHVGFSTSLILLTFGLSAVVGLFPIGGLCTWHGARAVEVGLKSHLDNLLQ